MVWNRYLLHNSSYVNCDMHRYTDISAYLCSCTSRDLEAPNRRLPGNHRVLCRNCAMETRPHWNTRPLGLCFLCRCPWDDITLVSDHDINTWRWEELKNFESVWHHELAACATFWSDTLKILRCWSPILPFGIQISEALTSWSTAEHWRFSSEFPKRNLFEVVVWQGGLLAFKRLVMQRCQL